MSLQDTTNYTKPRRMPRLCICCDKPVIPPRGICKRCARRPITEQMELGFESREVLNG